MKINVWIVKPGLSWKMMPAVVIQVNILSLKKVIVFVTHLLTVLKRMEFVFVMMLVISSRKIKLVFVRMALDSMMVNA